MEWRADSPLVCKEVSPDQGRVRLPDPKDRSFRQSHRRATARSGQAMFVAAVAWNRVVIASGGHGEPFCISAQIAACTGVKAERKPDQSDAGRREPRQPPTPTLSILIPGHRSGEAGNQFGYATA